MILVSRIMMKKWNLELFFNLFTYHWTDLDSIYIKIRDLAAV